LIKLTEDNHVVLRGHITNGNIVNIINKILGLKSKDIYIYISSQGGSVFAGLQLAEVIKSLESSGVNVYTICDFSASMAYAIHQHGKVRYIRSYGILMQHQMSLQLGGNIHNIQSYSTFMNSLNNKMMLHEANRANITLSSFDLLTQHDMWLIGEDAVKSKFADCVADVVCDFKLSTYEESMDTIFGKVYITYSTCPLIRAPIKVKFDSDSGIVITEEQKAEILEEYDMDYQILNGFKKII
jgi:ATP-dependent protease ClpP protease subunit